MTLREAIVNAISVDSQSDGDGVVYCLQRPKQCTPDSLCRIFLDEATTVLHRDGQTWYYFLEISIMQELYEDDIPTSDPTLLAERVDRILYYARHDA